MVLLETAAILSGIKDTFLYNRDNFMFDRKIDQERIYHTQKMRISQVLLFRDDLRDLFELTIKKMDHYLIINVLLLLFAGGFFYEGRLPQSSPAWLLWVWSMAIGSSIAFLSLSIWFAIHASITAQTFATRLLTQWLRLPIPGFEAIASASVKAPEFEQTRGRDMLRIPVVGTLEAVAPLAASIMSGDASQILHPKETPFTMPNDSMREELTQDWTLFVEHFHIFADLQRHWQGYDAYSRVCMVVGSNQFFSAIGYMGLAYFLLESSLWGSLSFLIVLQLFALFHALINLRLSEREKWIAAFFVFGPSLLSAVAASYSRIYININAQGDEPLLLAKWFSPFIYLLSMAWMIFLLHLGSDAEGGLPDRFVTVQSIDVLGLNEDEDRKTYETSTVLETLGTGLDRPIARAQSLRPIRRASHVRHTAVVKKQRIAAEEPVSLTIPQSEVLQKAEARRRTQIDVARAADDGDVLIEEAEEVRSDGEVDRPIGRRLTFLGMSFGGEASPRVVDRGDDYSDASVSDASEGDLVKQKYFKASARMMRLPWHAFNTVGAVIVALWLFSFIFSILVICDKSWGWPESAPLALS